MSNEPIPLGSVSWRSAPLHEFTCQNVALVCDADRRTTMPSLRRVADNVLVQQLMAAHRVRQPKLATKLGYVARLGTHRTSSEDGGQDV